MPSDQNDQPRRSSKHLELILGIALAGVLTGLGALGVLSLGWAVAFALPAVAILIFGGSILVAATGALTGHRGLSAGGGLVLLALVVTGILWGAGSAFRERGAAQATASLNIRPFAKPERVHDVLIVENAAYGERKDFKPSCDPQVCLGVLLQSPYRFAIMAENSAQAAIYSISSAPAVCRKPENRESMILLLGDGYLNRCVVGAEEPIPGDGLVIDRRPPIPGLRDDEHVVELRERIGGTEHVLGRWAAYANAHMDQSFQDADFIAAALGLPAGLKFPQGQDATAALSDALYGFIVAADTRRAALAALDHLMLERAATDGVAFQPVLLRLQETNDPELIAAAKELGRIRGIR